MLVVYKILHKYYCFIVEYCSYVLNEFLMSSQKFTVIPLIEKVDSVMECQLLFINVCL